jgi:BlaI family transcriptional regulator, penicillinase repressor
MVRATSKTPTAAELEVLHVIWRRGPSTLRQVHEALPTGLTRAAVFDRLEGMVHKGLLKVQRRSKGEGGGLYSPAYSREGMMGRMLRQLASWFGSSPKVLLQTLLKSGELDAEELRSLRRLVRSQRKKRKEP